MIFYSIIVPTYNSALTVRKCLDSIFYQTYENFEIIIVDGVSKDDTIEIIREYEDNRISIISEPDKGIYDAMNKGIKLAKGEWLYFLGTDDQIANIYVLSDVYSYLSVNRVDVLYGNVIFKPSEIIYDGAFSPLKMQEKPICHQAIFYHNRIFKIFGSYDLKYKVSADFDLNLKWFFSRRINSMYVDIIIAIYNESGYSSFTKDELFYRNFPKILFWRGFFTYSSYKLKELAIEIANKNRSNQLEYLSYSALYYFFRFIDKIKRYFR